MGTQQEKSIWQLQQELREWHDREYVQGYSKDSPENAPLLPERTAKEYAAFSWMVVLRRSMTIRSWDSHLEA